jgi:hypothetical protein
VIILGSSVLGCNKVIGADPAVSFTEAESIAKDFASKGYAPEKLDSYLTGIEFFKPLSSSEISLIRSMVQYIGSSKLQVSGAQVPADSNSVSIPSPGTTVPQAPVATAASMPNQSSDSTPKPVPSALGSATGPISAPMSPDSTVISQPNAAAQISSATLIQPGPPSSNTTASPSVNVANQAADISGFSALSSGGINYSSRATVAKLDLVDATTRFFGHSEMGVQISIAGVASSAAPTDALASQLLMRNNGALNLYLSPFSNYPGAWSKWASYLGESAPVGSRSIAPNRTYIDFGYVGDQVKNFLTEFYQIAPSDIHDPLKDSTVLLLDANGKPIRSTTVPPGEAAIPSQQEFERYQNDLAKIVDQTYFYITDGIGAKIYSNPQASATTAGSASTSASTTSNSNLYEGGGCAYLGFGGDGSLKDFIQNTSGAWNIEAYVATNTANRFLLDQSFNVSNAKSVFETGVIQMSVSVGMINLGLFYSVPLDSRTRSFMKDMGGFSLSIQQPKSTPASTTQ